jgi:hypothetical protein
MQLLLAVFTDIFLFYPLQVRYPVTSHRHFLFYPLIDQILGAYMLFYPLSGHVSGDFRHFCLYLLIGQVTCGYRHFLVYPFIGHISRNYRHFLFYPLIGQVQGNYKVQAVFLTDIFICYPFTGLILGN